MRICDVQNRVSLDSADEVRRFLVELVENLGMRILAGPLVGREGGRMDKSGVSGVVILYESHAAIHTYPHLGEAFLDVFSCKPYGISTIDKTLRTYFGSFHTKESERRDRGVHWTADAALELKTWQRAR